MGCTANANKFFAVGINIHERGPRGPLYYSNGFSIVAGSPTLIKNLANDWDKCSL
jgi:hypothetical protein